MQYYDIENESARPLNAMLVVFVFGYVHWFCSNIFLWFFLKSAAKIVMTLHEPHFFLSYALATKIPGFWLSFFSVQYKT